MTRFDAYPGRYSYARRTLAPRYYPHGNPFQPMPPSRVKAALGSAILAGVTLAAGASLGVIVMLAIGGVA